MEIKSICVVGGGKMGRQIALNSAIYGIKANVYDLSAEVCADVEAWAEEYLAGRIAKGRMTAEQVEKVKAIFHVERDLAKAVSDVDCAIEAVVERIDVKHIVLKQLSDLMREDAIIATNSSVMVSSLFVEDVKNPARLCNVHYYNPALVMKFVEVVQGDHTSEETGKACYEFCLKTGKQPAWLRKEIGGFLGNFIYGGIAGAAKGLVHDGCCTPQDLDIALEEGCGAKMGVFRTNDLTGLDTSLDVQTNGWKKSGIKPPMFDIYKEMVEKGWIGRKAGRGFYDYVNPAANEPTAMECKKEVASVTVIGDTEKAKKIAAEVEAAGIKTALCAADAVQAADLMIVAVGEDAAAQKAALQKAAAAAPAAILATTSALTPSSVFAGDVENPARLCTMYFHYTELTEKLVELVKNANTDEETFAACYNFCLKCGKKVARENMEVEGFACKKVFDAVEGKGRYLVANGYCEPRDVDAGLEFGFNYKKGPFRMQDMRGIDVVFAELEAAAADGNKPAMYDTYKEMVENGQLGKKSGKGFYDYN